MEFLTTSSAMEQCFHTGSHFVNFMHMLQVFSYYSSIGQLVAVMHRQIEPGANKDREEEDCIATKHGYKQIPFKLFKSTVNRKCFVMKEVHSTPQFLLLRNNKHNFCVVTKKLCSASLS